MDFNFLLSLLILVSYTLPHMLSYNLIFGRTKILYFGPLAMSLMVAYPLFLTLMATGSYTLAIVAGILGGLITAVLFAWLALRLESDAFGVMSIAVHLIFLAIVLNSSSLTRGALGLPGIPRFSAFESPGMFALLVFLCAFAFLLLMWWIDHGPLGRKLKAMAQSKEHAQALGISQGWLYLIVFLVEVLGALLNNLFIAQYIHLAHPSDFAFILVPLFITYAVAGTPGSVIGVTLATILLTLFKEGLRFLPIPLGMIGSFRLVLFGAILLAAVWWRRKELFPMQRTV